MELKRDRQYAASLDDLTMHLVRVNGSDSAASRDQSGGGGWSAAPAAWRVLGATCATPWSLGHTAAVPAQ